MDAPERTPTAPDEFSAGKAPSTSGPTVAAADPSYGRQGDAGYRVTITGSGFEPGSQASWERNGTVDPKISVRSTDYVSSTQLVATIDIASDAELALYDLAVTSSRGKGIGTEKFEVTNGTSIGTLSGSNTLVRGINSTGQATGYSGSETFFWDAPTQTMVNLGPGMGWDVDEAGRTVVGVSSSHATVWTRDGTGWRRTALPRDPTALSSRASSVASDPVTGEAIFVAGEERFRHSGHQPRVWQRGSSGAWERRLLPMPVEGSAWANDVNARGQVVANVHPSTGARFNMLWEPNGAAWTYVVGPGGQSINGTGTMTVGTNEEAAVYWKRLPDGSWTGPLRLRGTCVYAVAIDDDGRIAATRCLFGDRYGGAVFLTPDAEPTHLGGLGDITEGSWVESMSLRGGWIGGTAPTRPVKPGVVWNPFLVF